MSLYVPMQLIHEELRRNRRPADRPRLLARLEVLRAEQRELTLAELASDERFNARFNPPARARVVAETWTELRCRNCDTLLNQQHPRHPGDSRYCLACGVAGEDHR